MTEVRGQKTEDGRRKTEDRCRKWECGLRPLRAVGSLYEPEAIGDYAYAPAGSRKVSAWGKGQSAKGNKR